MWLFWICAVAMAAGAAALVSAAAARAARRSDADGADPALTLYTRQLAEVRELGRRGLIEAGDLRDAEAEAGRRLLGRAGQPPQPWRKARNGARWALGGAALAGAGALTLYLVTGSPNAPDQPYRARLAAWRRADPARLAPDQMAAVLEAVSRERPNDPVAFEFLGRARLAAGDPVTAAQAFSTAARLAPGSASVQAELGETLTLASGGKVTPDAEAAFRRAQRLDPANPAARYFLARLSVAKGEVAQGVAAWRALAADLAPSDPRRPALLAEIAQTTGQTTGQATADMTRGIGGGAPPPAASGAKLDAATAGLARGMVARLAARLDAAPDDPAGWARLIRAYGVLGDPAAQARALAKARALFKGRPDALRAVEVEAQPSPAG